MPEDAFAGGRGRIDEAVGIVIGDDVEVVDMDTVKPPAARRLMGDVVRRIALPAKIGNMEQKS